jgi:hypothetical protein
LTEELVAVMDGEAFLKDGEGEADVLDDESVESDGSVVDVAESHRKGIDEEEERIAGSKPVRRQQSVSSRGREGKANALLLDVDSVGSHEGKVELDGLEVQDLEVKVTALRGRLGFRDLVGVFREFAAREGRQRALREGQVEKQDERRRLFETGRAGELGEVEEGEEEVFVHFDRHLLEEDRGVLEVGDAVS